VKKVVEKVVEKVVSETEPQNILFLQNPIEVLKLIFHYFCHPFFTTFYTPFHYFFTPFYTHLLKETIYIFLLKMSQAK